MEVFWSGWGSPVDYAKHSAAGGLPIPYLDCSGPVVASLRELRRHFSYPDYQDIVSGIRAILQLGDDAELDDDDASLVMRAWEARNESRMISP